jgi:hypothetical protein
MLLLGLLIGACAVAVRFVPAIRLVNRPGTGASLNELVTYYSADGHVLANAGVLLLAAAGVFFYEELMAAHIAAISPKHKWGWHTRWLFLLGAGVLIVAGVIEGCSEASLLAAVHANWFVHGLNIGANTTPVVPAIGAACMMTGLGVTLRSLHQLPAFGNISVLLGVATIGLAGFFHLLVLVGFVVWLPVAAVLVARHTHARAAVRS